MSHTPELDKPEVRQWLRQEWMARLDSDKLSYSNTCCCMADLAAPKAIRASKTSAIRCAGHLFLRNQVTGKEVLWPEPRTVTFTEEIFHVVNQIGADDVKQQDEYWTYIDLDLQASYGPEFKTEEDAVDYRKWLGEIEVKKMTELEHKLFYGLFQAGMSGNPQVRVNVTDVTMSEPCGSKLSECICTKAAKHEDDAHKCGCGGSWRMEHGKPIILSFPIRGSVGSIGRSLNKLLGLQ